MLHINARCKHMFQVFSGVSYVSLRMFHLDVGLQLFSNVFQPFSLVFSDACFKCFICLLLYVATVASQKWIGCCTWDARWKRPAARTIGAAWVTS